MYVGYGHNYGRYFSILPDSFNQVPFGGKEKKEKGGGKRI
jgi:hypothetical protein